MTHGNCDQFATIASRRAIKVAQKHEIAEDSRCMKIYSRRQEAEHTDDKREAGRN